MAQVKLNDRQYDAKDCLTINIGDKEYTMPLANRMPLKVLRKLNANADIDIIVEVLSEFIPEEEVPLAVPVVDEEVIIEEPVPLAVPKLPKTGGVAPLFFYGGGALLLGAGIVMLKKKNDDDEK